MSKIVPIAILLLAGCSMLQDEAHKNRRPPRDNPKMMTEGDMAMGKDSMKLIRENKIMQN